ncbi:MAG: beta-lactamase [Chitinophagaceae bacterium]|nr:beta-lactamase [Chitinophagaceae bacterium]
MSKQFIGFLFIMGFPVWMYGQKMSLLEQLRQDITGTLATQQGEFAVAFKDLLSGKKLLIHEHEFFHAASTMKTPVMIEVFNQAAKGKFALSDSVIIKNEFISIADSSQYHLDSTDDSEYETYKHIGEKRTIGDLMYQMIISSSNLATNLIIGLVDARNVTQTLRGFGAKDIVVLRGVEDQKAFDKGLNNTTTAYDLMLIFEKLANGKAVNKKASEAMIKILLDQQFNDIIPAKLPPGVKVAHKTGSITAVHHDSGIVFLPDGRKYVLVLLSKNLLDENAAIKAMATVSDMIYQYVHGK